MSLWTLFGLRPAERLQREHADGTECQRPNDWIERRNEGEQQYRASGPDPGWTGARRRNNAHD
ncbi:MAG: hypothetical protein SV583_01790 [Pseudomonadota bacterium]|nr:hypothetical protein [Pseudomonadota bacterium]